MNGTPVPLFFAPGVYWAHPWVLAAIPLLPLLWLLWRRPTRAPVLRFSGLDGLRAAGGAASRRARLSLPILRTAALACLLVVVARPVLPDETSRIFAEGIAIEMVVDTSSSMSDTDLSPRGQRRTRLDVVKDVFRKFVLGENDLPGRRNDLIGMTRFARYADSLCPLTLDHDALLDVLEKTDTVRPNSPEDGTAIGDGLGLAVERLRDLMRTTGSGEQVKITSRVVILLTDGENNFGMVSPEQAGELAATHGIKVYTILAGLGQRLPFGGRMPVDDRPLRHIAEVSGGRHFTARDADSLKEIYEQIDQLERTRVEERTSVRWSDLAAPWLMTAFVCLAVQTFLEATRMRKIP